MDEITRDEPAGRPTMSVGDAARLAGVSEDTVRRWIDAMDLAGMPVAERERGEDGQPVSGRHRKPYVDAVEAWIRRRRGGRPAEGLGAGGGSVGG